MAWPRRRREHIGSQESEIRAGSLAKMGIAEEERSEVGDQRSEVRGQRSFSLDFRLLISDLILPIFPCFLEANADETPLPYA
jgi:hypothetical protein